MPSKTDLASLLEKAQSRWVKADEEDRRKRAEAEKQARTQMIKDQAAKDVQASKEASNMSPLAKIIKFGPSAAVDTAKGVGQGIKDQVTDYAGSIALALGAGGPTKGQAAANTTLQNSQSNIIRMLRDPNIPQTRKDVLLKSLNETNRQLVEEATQNTKDVEETTDIKKFIGNTLAYGSLPFGGAGLGSALRAGSIRGAVRAGAPTVGAGATAGVGTELAAEGPVTPGSLLAAGGIGAGLGLAADFGMAGLGAIIRRSRSSGKGVAQELIDEINKPPQAPITDPSRLLPQQATKMNAQPSAVTMQVRQDPNLAVVTRGANIRDVKALEAVEKQIAVAQQTGNITAAEARVLVAERQTLLDRVQNPRTALGQEIQRVDTELAAAASTGSKSKVMALEADRRFLQQEAATMAAQSEFDDMIAVTLPRRTGGKEQVSRLAERTEAKAVRDKLTEGFGDLPTYKTTNWDDEAAVVVEHMNRDPEGALRIAMGMDPSPQGVTSGSYYVGVANRAFKEGNIDLIERLGTEGAVPTTASKMGQEISALSQFDPESPITAIRNVVKARKESPLKLPPTVTRIETEKLYSMAKEVSDAKEAMMVGGDRMAYGKARVAYDNYVNDLIETANKTNIKEALKTPLKSTGKGLTNLAGITKSLRASLDNSALLRQGWKTLFTHPGVWAKNSAKSFVDWVRAAGNKPVLDEVGADIVSRDNAINGMYKRMKLDVLGVTEEAYPTSVPGRIPVLGRAFKGSEAAYTAWAQRTRADLADKYLEIARKSGVDLTSKKELQAIGNLVNTLTSRGKLKTFSSARTAETLNNVFFSPRLLRSNWDVLTAHTFQPGTTSFVRKRAARNLVQIAVGSAAALKLASEVTGGKVEWDPRSSNFGKVKIGDTRFDLSGGMSSIVTLGSRIATTSTKSSTTGEVKKLNSGDFNAQDTTDVIYNFFENKTSPAAAVMRDWLKGETFTGEKPTATTTVRDLTLPLIIGNSKELFNNPRAAAVVPSMIAEALGISVNTYGLESKWNNSNSKQVKAFKDKVSKETFESANKTFNDNFNGWYERVSADGRFWSLPQERREALVLNKKNALTEEVMQDQGFKYRQPKKDRSAEELAKELKKY